MDNIDLGVAYKTGKMDAVEVMKAQDTKVEAGYVVAYGDAGGEYQEMGADLHPLGVVGADVDGYDDVSSIIRSGLRISVRAHSSLITAGVVVVGHPVEVETDGTVSEAGQPTGILTNAKFASETIYEDANGVKCVLIDMDGSL